MHLSEYMAKRKLTDAAVAEAIERDRATVSRIRRRLIRPDWDTIRALKEFSGGKIGADDFLEIGARQ